MASRYILMRAMVLGAVRTAVAPKTPIQVLEDIVIGRFRTEISDGKTVIAATEGGGSVTFSLPAELGPGDVTELAMRAIAFIRSCPDPNNPPLYPRIIRRLRASFAKAVI